MAETLHATLGLPVWETSTKSCIDITATFQNNFTPYLQSQVQKLKIPSKNVGQCDLFKNRSNWLSVHCRNGTVPVSASPAQTILTKRIKGSLFLLILMWWAFISLCNSRCPWSRSQEGLSSNNRIAPSEMKEHSDSPPDYDTVLGNCSKPILDLRPQKPYGKVTQPGPK